MGTSMRDLDFAWRMLRKNPGFTTAVVLCLALSLGANTAVFSLLNAVLLRELPYREPDRILMIWNSFLADGQPKAVLSYRELLDLREQTSSWSDIAATRSGLFNVTGDGEPELCVGVRVVGQPLPPAGRRGGSRPHLPPGGGPAGPRRRRDPQPRALRAASAPTRDPGPHDDDRRRALHGGRRHAARLPFPAQGAGLWIPLVLDRGRAPGATTAAWSLRARSSPA